jgi:hypothetical protein
VRADAVLMRTRAASVRAAESGTTVGTKM